MRKERSKHQKYKFASQHEFEDLLKTEKSRYRFLEYIFWDNKPKCPHCGCNKKPNKANSRRRIPELKVIPTYRCSNRKCNLPFTVRTNTILDGSKLVLRNWFTAIYEFAVSKNGYSALELSRRLKIDHKTALLMKQKIRAVLIDDPDYKLDGIVQIDEAYVGGKNKNRHKHKKYENAQGRSGIDKAKVLGITNGNELRTFVVPAIDVRTVQPILFQNIAEMPRL